MGLSRMSSVTAHIVKLTHELFDAVAAAGSRINPTLE
jgi:hypothetical protein